ncbi:MAG TPA: amidohydrolase [Bryobacteraceae bacterium]|jgi:predicted amidohydrolase YtcJ|nr:amidohydrolase [Bryobacteraceae bacterium]
MILILALFSGLMGAPAASLVVTGARIYTLNPRQPLASALAVKDGRILAVGDEVGAYLGPNTRRIDARGATVIPGLIDSHVHLRGLGDSLEILDLRPTRSAEQIAAMVRDSARNLKPGEWIRGRSWDQTAWPSREFPEEGVLSKAAPDNPVYLTRVDGHAAWVNRKALEIADIHAATPDPPGGRIVRGSNGAPTGVLIDGAQALVSRRMPAGTLEQTVKQIERAARECARLGLTSVHDAGVSKLDLAACRRLIAEGRLPVRVYAMIAGEGPLWREYLKRGPETSDRLTVRSIKLMADGALGSRGAALLAPYADDPGNSGLLTLRKADIERVAREAAVRGFQVNTHAIGDRANRMVLEAYAAALGGKNDRRFRIEHAQVVAPEDFPLFARYSIIASIQATHATSDMRWAEARLGPRRIRGAYAWREFLDLGVAVANGSDFPVEEPDPLRGFHAAVTRQDDAGSPPGGWQPGQRMTREEALRSWTAGGAFASFDEKSKGSLEPGKLADFLVLSRDIMKVPADEIRGTRVTLTVLGGEIVFSE